MKPGGRRRRRRGRRRGQVVVEGLLSRIKGQEILR